MKAKTLAFGAAAALLLVLGFGAGAAEKNRVLHVYTWSDYFDSGVIRQFELANDCRVSIDYFDSNEAMYAKLKAGGGGYDVITPSSYMSAVMHRQDMLLDLDHSALPHLPNIDPNFTVHTEDPDMRYSVPYTRTVTGVGYNRLKVSEAALGDWSIFGDARYAKRMTMLNDMRETIGAALKHLGFSLNSTDDAELAQAGDILVKWKRNLAKFDVDEAKIGLGAEEFYAVHAYNGDIALIMLENSDIDFYIPQEGSSLTSDDFVITADTPEAVLAHAFINHMLDSEVAAVNMDSIRYYMPNPRAVEMLDSEELRGNPSFNIPDELVARCEVIRDLGPDNAKYIQVWDRVKASE